MSPLFDHSDVYAGQAGERPDVDVALDTAPGRNGVHTHPEKLGDRRPRLTEKSASSQQEARRAEGLASPRTAGRDRVLSRGQ